VSKPELHIVVLAAGKGSRMKSTMPKVLHCIAGKPLLGHVLDATTGLEPTQIHVVVGHGKEAVTDYIDSYSSATTYSISAVEQARQKGTGDAVKQALPSIPDSATVLMLTADVPLVSTISLAELATSMQTVTLSLLTAIVPNPTGLGRIIRDESDNVVSIIEEKDANQQQRGIKEINSGILCARARELKSWLDMITPNNAQGEYYLTDIVALAHEQGQVVQATQASSHTEVEGINTRIQLAKVERLYQQKRSAQLMENGVTIIDPSRLDIRGEVEIGVDTSIDINCVIEGPTKIGKNVRIGPNCLISASIIGDGSIINANTVIESAVIAKQVSVGPFARLRPGTELDDEVRIGNFVETKNAKLAAGAKANHLSYVGDSTVGKNTNIGAGVITCNYDGANKHQTQIGNDVFVGSDSQLVAPVIIEDGATIGAGSTITNTVETGQLAISRARQRLINDWKRPTKSSKQTKSK